MINPRPDDLEYDTDEAADYIWMFKEAMEQDAEEDTIAAEIYALHLDVRSRYDLYIAIKDGLGTTYGNAIRKYIEIYKCSPKPLLSNGRSRL